MKLDGDCHNCKRPIGCPSNSPRKGKGPKKRKDDIFAIGKIKKNTLLTHYVQFYHNNFTRFSLI